MVRQMGRNIEDQLEQERKAAAKWEKRATRAEGWLLVIAICILFMIVLVACDAVSDSANTLDCNKVGYSDYRVVYGTSYCLRIEEGVLVLVPLETVRERLEERREK